MGRLRITLRRSLIGHPRSQKETAKALGLTRPHRTVVRPDSAPIRGMIGKIGHLVSVEHIEENGEQRGS